MVDSIVVWAAVGVGRHLHIAFLSSRVKRGLLVGSIRIYRQTCRSVFFQKLADLVYTATGPVWIQVGVGLELAWSVLAVSC